MSMIAVKAGLLIDGTGEKPIKNAVVLVEDGRITKVGLISNTVIPSQGLVLAVQRIIDNWIGDVIAHESCRAKLRKKKLDPVPTLHYSSLVYFRRAPQRPQ